MIKPFLLLLLFFSPIFSIAQQPASWYNHTSLNVHNMDTSVAFYTKVFQVDTIPCPFVSDARRRVKWLKVGEGVELHLVQWFADTTKSVDPARLRRLGIVHLGFMVTSLDAFLKRLSEVSSDYRIGKLKPNVGTMPYGAKTANIYDPDGNLIHVIEALPAKQ